MSILPLPGRYSAVAVREDLRFSSVCTAPPIFIGAYIAARPRLSLRNALGAGAVIGGLCCCAAT